jgi:hypothetical protein
MILHYISGMSSSDVYLKMHQKQQLEWHDKKGSKKKKKPRKSKKNQVDSEEEEVPVAHVVSTKMDAPEVREAPILLLPLWPVHCHVQKKKQDKFCWI